MNPLAKHIRWTWLTLFGLAALVVVILVHPAMAGPVTNPGNSPFVKLGVYQGVIAVVPDGGANVLEIGNAGRDIASSGDLYLRPGGVSAANAIKIGRATFAEAAITPQGGRICLDPAQNGASWDCQLAWSSGSGTGDLLWTSAGGKVYPRLQCAGGANAGNICTVATQATDCPGSTCVSIADNIQIGTLNGQRICVSGMAPTGTPVSCTGDAQCASYNVCVGGSSLPGDNYNCSNNNDCATHYRDFNVTCAPSTCEVVGDGSVSGTALSVLTNSDSSALNVDGNLSTGYHTAPDFYQVHSGGNVNVNGGQLFLGGMITVLSVTPWSQIVTPWSQADTFYDGTRPIAFNTYGSGIDADTFDATANLGLVQSDKNIVWKVPVGYDTGTCKLNPAVSCLASTSATACPNVNRATSIPSVCVAGPNKGTKCISGGTAAETNQICGGFCSGGSAPNFTIPCHFATTTADCGPTGSNCVVPTGMCDEYKACASGPNTGAVCTSYNKDTVCGITPSCTATTQKKCAPSSPTNQRQPCVSETDCGGTVGSTSFCTTPQRCGGLCEYSNYSGGNQCEGTSNTGRNLYCGGGGTSWGSCTGYNDGLNCQSDSACNPPGNPSYGGWCDNGAGVCETASPYSLSGLCTNKNPFGNPGACPAGQTCRKLFCNTTGLMAYGNEAYGSGDCPIQLNSCVLNPKPVMCVGLKSSTDAACGGAGTGGKICQTAASATDIGKPCCSDVQCGGLAGSCTRMCGANTATCAPSANGRSNVTAPIVALPNLYCANFHKRYASFCTGSGTATTHLCQTNDECRRLYGITSSCSPRICANTCQAPSGYWCQNDHNVACNDAADSGSICASRGAGSCVQNPFYTKTCTADSQCADVAGGPSYRCGMTLCEGQGTCRLSMSTPIVGGMAGYCYLQNSCTKNSDCDVTNGGSLAESGSCVSMGYCAAGDEGLTPRKTCVGGTRGASTVRNPGLCSGGSAPGTTCRPNVDTCSGGGTCVPQTINCSSRTICIGGSGDSLYDAHDSANVTACTSRGGRIGNAFDYCPDAGSTCRAELSCSSASECGNGQTCFYGEPADTGSSNASYCQYVCKNLPVNRCRGQSDVFGDPLNSCSTYGIQPTYEYGSVRGLNGSSYYYGCDCTTDEQKYATPSTTNAQVCSQPFL